MWSFRVCQSQPYIDITVTLNGWVPDSFGSPTLLSDTKSHFPVTTRTVMAICLAHTHTSTCTRTRRLTISPFPPPSESRAALTAADERVVRRQLDAEARCSVETPFLNSQRKYACKVSHQGRRVVDRTWPPEPLWGAKDGCLISDKAFFDQISLINYSSTHFLFEKTVIKCTLIYTGMWAWCKHIS